MKLHVPSPFFIQQQSLAIVALVAAMSYSVLQQRPAESPRSELVPCKTGATIMERYNKYGGDPETPYRHWVLHQLVGVLCVAHDRCTNMVFTRICWNHDVA